MIQVGDINNLGIAQQLFGNVTFSHYRDTALHVEENLLSNRLLNSYGG